MDYSTSDGEFLENPETFSEPEIVEDTNEGVEPVIGEVELQEENPVDTATSLGDSDQTNPPVDQTPDDIGFHSQPGGIEVPGSPDTEPIQDPNIRDRGMHGGGPEGGY